MAWEARLGLKPEMPVCSLDRPPRLNGLGSPSGIETFEEVPAMIVALGG